MIQLLSEHIFLTVPVVCIVLFALVWALSGLLDLLDGFLFWRSDVKREGESKDE